MRISIIMPAFNEEKNIRKTVMDCFTVLNNLPGKHEVVVTNDGSTDKTADILRDLADKNDNLVVAVNSPNQGYGAALIKAIEASSGDVLVTIDSDGQFDISELPDLMSEFTDSIDILTGYRRAKQDSLFKVAADRVMNRMIRCMFGVAFKDTNCAFKVVRKSSLAMVMLEARGFQIPTEIVLKAHQAGLAVREAPVSHAARTGGSSSLAPFRTAFRMLSFLIYLRLKISVYKRRIIRSL